MRKQERARAKRYRKNKRAKADEHRKATGQNVPRPPHWFIRSRRFPRYRDYLAWKQGKDWPLPSRSMLWRPYVRPEYWGKPTEVLAVRVYREAFAKWLPNLPGYFRRSAWGPFMARSTRPRDVPIHYSKEKSPSSRGLGDSQKREDLPRVSLERPKWELKMPEKKPPAESPPICTPAESREDALLRQAVQERRRDLDIERWEPRRLEMPAYLKTKRAKKILEREKQAFLLNPTALPLERDQSFLADVEAKKAKWKALLA